MVAWEALQWLSDEEIVHIYCWRVESTPNGMHYHALVSIPAAKDAVHFRLMWPHFEIDPDETTPHR